MPDSPLHRRLLTVTTVIVAFLLLTALSPLLVLVGAGIDGLRAVTRDKPWMTVRIFAFSWLYLLGQLGALVGLLVTTPMPGPARERATFALQAVWTNWNFASLRAVFSLDLEVEGQECATEGPYILLARHASIVDTMLPARLVANPLGIRLRYVLKRELLVDPTLDIGGNRLPNHFINRGAGDSTPEIEAIRGLASGLGSRDALLIYPEGTRYSEEKRVRYVARLSRRDGTIAEMAKGFRLVLPPRPGGTLALLDETDADIVILAHHGLEGLATARDIWSGGMVGSKIRARLWRIPRNEIPDGRRDRLEWLFEVWGDVDDWVFDAAQISRQPAS